MREGRGKKEKGGGNKRERKGDNKSRPSKTITVRKGVFLSLKVIKKILKLYQISKKKSSKTKAELYQN